MAGYPPYVDRYGHGEVTMLPPGNIIKAKIYAFVIEADSAKLQKLVDSQLNAPAKGAIDYRVIGGRTVATYLDAERLTSVPQKVGWVPDQEFALWIALAAVESGKVDRLVFYNPYLVVDTSIAMATGREVWGFRKDVGRLWVPSRKEDDARFIASSTLFKTLDWNTEGEVQPLLTVHRDAKLGKSLTQEWTGIEHAFRGILALLHDGGSHATVFTREDEERLMVDASEHLLAHEVPMANLKQFRDAADPTRACYQALIEGPATIHKLRGGGPLLGGWKARVTPCESHPLVEDLGLAGTEVPVEIGLWIDVDFTADLGREVWKAT